MRRLAVRFEGLPAAWRQLRRRHLVINLALGGFYTPIARRREAQWLAQNTSIDHTPIESVPVAASRWPAMAIVALFIALRIATDVGFGPPLAVVVAAGALMLPYLWGFSTARRVNAVRWRGVQLVFAASWAAIYRASWPLFAIAVPWAWLAPRVAASSAGGELHFSHALLLELAMLGLLAYPLLLRLGYNYARLLAAGALANGEPALWPARFSTYAGVWVATTLAFALSVFPVLLALRYALLGSVGMPQGLTGWPVIAVSLAGAVLAFLLSAPARAWHEARMFRLRWDGLQWAGATFECTLDAGRYVRLRGLKHGAAAALEAYRMKAESVTLVAAR